MVYCLIPQVLAPKLHDLLRRHFRDERDVEVIVDRRGRERRIAGERRTGEPKTPAQERRLIRGEGGRRVGERRAPLVSVDPPRELPRRATRHADALVFVERLEPSTQDVEDRDSARLVTRFQAGERESAFAAVYNRYFDRVYGYLRNALRDPHEAEDAAQQVFTQMFEALPRYERRRQPFRAWLFVLVRNEAVSRLRKSGRLTVEESATIERRRDAAVGDGEPQALDWLSDRDLMLFVERLPLAQRQVLLLRYVLDLSNIQIAEILERTPTDVGKLHHRAVGVLRDRLAAVGRTPDQPAQRVDWRRRTRRVQTLRARRFALTWRS
jgi:RNA polymerase sigma-70 factor (ECF subfamily)